MTSHASLVGTQIGDSAAPLSPVEYKKESTSSPSSTNLSEGDNVIPLEVDAKDSLSNSSDVIDSCNSLNKSTLSGIYIIMNAYVWLL